MSRTLTERPRSHGPVTVLTFQLINVGEKVFDGYNWLTATIVYGAAGSLAEHKVSLSKQFGAGAQDAIRPVHARR
ncbi:hypothetical protein [Nocardia sp. NBC_00403]|uniref:hypothetical protein n=1 Tax=Nocardia sp. NBC_00403 TaxID=2975990 RepID=UPI002E1A9D38